MAYETLKDAIKQAIKQNDNQEITGDVLQTTLLNIVDNIPTENDYIKDTIMSSLSDYTYWSPSSKPYIDSNNENIVWDHITIYGIQSHRILVSRNNVKVPISGSLSFILVNVKTLSFMQVALQSWASPAEDYITLAVIENGVIYDFLAINSRFIPHEYDLSSIGKALRLYPEAIHTTEPILYNSFNIPGMIRTIERSNLVDIRITSSMPIHERYDFIHIAGEAYAEKDSFKSAISNLKLYISRTDKDSHNLMVEIPVDKSTYKFDAIIDIPKSTYSSIDLENIGYVIYAFIYNKNGVSTTLKISNAYVASYPGKSDQRLLEDNRDTLKYLTNNFIDIDRSFKVFGSSYKFLGLSFPIVKGHIGVFATVLNSQADEDGFLSSVTTSINGTGQVYKFLVGLLDQYNRFVPSREFNVYIPAGENSKVDISSMYVPIFKGEQLAISVLSISELSAQSSIKYIERSSADDSYYEDNLFYGRLDEVWHKLLNSNGGYINLAYEMKSVKSIFAFNSDVESLKSSIADLKDELNVNKYIYDDDGYAYTLSVSDNRELVVKAVNYSSVLALGNSLTSHGYAPNIGYYGDDEWAMASTNKETTTWTKHLQDILQQKRPSASVTPLNIAAWETAPTTANLNDIFKEHIGKNYDMIIFRAGENGTADSNYSSGFDKLIKFLMSSFPNAKIVITSMIWSNTVKDKVFKDIANQYNLQYINIGNIADKCILGQMLLGRDDEFHPIIHNGVASHCTDYCFFNLANVIGTNLGYKAISGSHSVQVITSGTEYSINQLNQIKDGYVTILTYGSNAPELTADIDSVNFKHISLSNVDWINTPSKKPSFASVFKMPDSDVIINI